MALVSDTAASQVKAGEQLAGEQEVAQMVDAEMDLEPVLGQPAAIDADAGIVDQDVEVPARTGECLGGRPDRAQRGEVELEELRAAPVALSQSRIWLGPLRRPTRCDHMDPSAGQPDRRGPADPRIGAGDQCDRHRLRASAALTAISEPALSLFWCTSRPTSWSTP